MTVNTLRKDLPHWNWKATRSGFGWNYVGSIKGPNDQLIQVLVYPVAHWTGREDRYSTEWRVEHGLYSEPYTAFRLKERERRDGNV